MAMDDLYKAFAQFKQGVQELSFQRTLNQANEAVRQVRNSELNEQEKLNNLRRIAEQLTFTLAGQGVPATTIQQLSDHIAPETPKTLDQALLSPNEVFRQAGMDAWKMKADAEAQAFARHQAAIDARQARSFEQQEKMAGRREEKAISKEARATLNKTQSAYNSNIKELRSATHYARTGLSIVNSDGPASKMIGAVQFMAARASGSNSQLSDREREVLAGSQSLLDQFMQLTSTKARSQFIEKNKEIFRDLFKTYVDAASEMEREIAEQYTNQLLANTLFADSDPNQLISDISGKRITEFRSSNNSSPEPQPTLNSTPSSSRSPSGSLPSWVRPRGRDQ